MLFETCAKSKFWKSEKFTQSQDAAFTDYRPLVCMEEGNQSGDLAISGGHGNDLEEYAMRRRRIQCPDQSKI